jgi:prepilin-type N-terminal cleavage/methylation domain-containing protein
MRGFTLIELMVVISIIGMLAALTLVVISNARIKSRDTKRVADIRQVISGLELYFNDCGSYPIYATAIKFDSTYNLYHGTSATCGTNAGDSTVNGGLGTTSGTRGTVYVQQMPTAITPADGATCQAAATPPAGAIANDFHYAGSLTTYTITFCLGNGIGQYGAGVHTATPSGIN